MKVARIETRHCDAGWRNYHSAENCIMLACSRQL